MATFRLLVKGTPIEACKAAEIHGLLDPKVLSSTVKETRIEVEAWTPKIIHDWFAELPYNAVRFPSGTLLHFVQRP